MKRNITVLLISILSTLSLSYSQNNVDSLNIFFQKAIEENNIQWVSKLITEGAQVNTHFPTIENPTPLHLAALHNSYEIAKLLIFNGANTETKDWLGLTPLHYAAQANSAETIELLALQHANIEAKDWNNLTPLHFASKSNSIEAVKVLLAYNANIETYDRNGSTPLHFAAMENATLCAEILLQNGANIEAFDNQQNTPLHIAIQYNAIETIIFLLNCNCNLNAQNYKGETPLHNAVKTGNNIVIELLLQNGANINSQNNSNDTPIFLAAKLDNIETIDLLISKHSQITNPQTNKFLIHAAIEGHAKNTFRYCLEKFGIPNSKYSYIDTLLLHEVSNPKDIFWIKALLLLGANPFYNSEYHKNAVEIANFQNRPDIAYILLNPNNLQLLFQLGMKELITQIILKNPKDIFYKDENNNTILHDAVKFGDTSLVEIILKIDSLQIILNQEDNLGRTPLFVAALLNKVKIIKMLLNQDSINAYKPDINGFTPYYLTLYNNDSVVRNALIKFDSISLIPKLVLPILAELNYNKNCFDISPDNKYLLTASVNRLINLWDIKTGKLIRSFTGHYGDITSVKFSYDGTLALSTAKDNTLIIWNIATGYEIQKFEFNTLNNSCSGFSPNNLMFFSISNNKTLKLWNLKTGIEVFSCNAKKSTFSTDGKLMLINTNDSILELWNTQPFNKIQNFKEHQANFENFSFSTDEKFVLTVSSDKTIKIWDTNTGTKTLTLAGHNSKIRNALFTYNSKNIISFDTENVTKIWDAENGKELASFQKGNFVGIIDSNILFHNDTTIQFFNYINNFEKIFFSSPYYIKTVILSESLKMITIVFENRFETIDLQTLKHTIYSTCTSSLKNLCFNTDGSLIYFSDNHNTKCFSLKKRLTFETDFSDMQSPSINETTTLKINYNTVSLISNDNSNQIQLLNGHYQGVNSAMFSHDKTKIVTASADETIKIWDTPTAAISCTLIGHAASVTSASFSHNDSLIISTSYDKTIKLWNLSTQKCTNTLQGHNESVNCATFSENDSLIISGSSDKTIKLWNVATGDVIHTFLGHTAAVNSVAFHPSGKFIFSNGNDNMLKIWSVENLCEIATIIFIDSTDWVVVTPNGIFDATENAMNKMHFVFGMEVIEFNQLKDRYYEPYLLQKLLGYEEGEIRSPSQGINNLRLYPEIKLNPIHDGILELDLQIREGGQGKIEIAINGKLEDIYPKTFTVSEDKMNKTVVYDFSNYQGFNNGENQISARVFNEDNLVASHWETIDYYTEIAGTVTIPEFYALVVGTSDYSGSEIDLSYAADDADEFSNVLQLAANKLFGAEHVHITTLTTNGTFPTKQRIEAAIAEFQQLSENDNVTPQNTYFLSFFSGHGKAYGGSEGDFYYLTPEAFNFNLEDEVIRAERSISAQEMISYFQKVSALKQVLILDACYSGQAISQFMQQKADILSNNIKIYENLRDKTGMFLLASSAADALSYEANRYGQGLLTYCLLSGMAGQALDKNQFVDVAQLFDFIGEQVPILAKDLGSIQKPQIHRPTHGQSFYIGELTANELKNITLNVEKPIILKTFFEDANLWYDTLNLTEITNNILLNESNKQDSEIIFIEADYLNEAYKIKCRYTQSGSKIKATVKIFCKDSVITEFSEKASTAEELCKLIVEKTLQILRQ